MKLYGQDVPQSVIDAGNAAMVGRFTQKDVNRAICRTGDLRFGYGDLSDRLVRGAGKAGKVRYEGGYWHEVVK